MNVYGVLRWLDKLGVALATTRGERDTWPPVISGREPLEVAVLGNRLVISVGVEVLAYAIAQKPREEDVFRVTDPHQAAASIRRALIHEQEDGTTPVHKLLDRAAFDAWENGDDGFE